MQNQDHQAAHRHRVSADHDLTETSLRLEFASREIETNQNQKRTENQRRKNYVKESRNEEVEQIVRQERNDQRSECERFRSGQRWKRKNLYQHLRRYMQNAIYLSGLSHRDRMHQSWLNSQRPRVKALGNQF
jgi:predicted ATP-dependent endonuclease of OLD family